MWTSAYSSIVTVALCTTAVWMGASTLIGANGGRSPSAGLPVLHFTPEVPAWNVYSPLEPWPVFVLDNHGFPSLCGHAWPAPTIAAENIDVKAVSIQPFLSQRCRERLLAQDKLAVYPTQFMLVWALLPEDERALVVNNLFGDAQFPWNGMLAQLQDFDTDGDASRLVIQRVMSALVSAMRSTEVEDRLLALFDVLDPRVVTELEDALWAVTRSHAGNELWESLIGWPKRWFASGDDSPHTGFATRLIGAMNNDPRTREALTHAFDHAAKKPETARFLSALLQEFTTVLLTDPQLASSLETVLAGASFDTFSGHLTTNSERERLKQILTELPEQLLRHRHPRDHNVLVTFLVRDMILGRSGHLLIALDTNRHHQIAAFSESMLLHPANIAP